MNESSAPQRPSTFPVKTLLVTCLVVGVVVFLSLNIVSLNQQYAIDMAMPTIVGVIGFLVCWALWVGWALLINRSMIWSTLIGLLPVAFLTLFYIDFGGDAEVSFRPRFWNWKSTDYSTLDPSAAVGIDIGTTTEFDFPQFLGPDRNLRTSAVQLSSDWDANPPEKIWQIDVGDAWSGFAIVNGFAITQEQRGPDECVTCYDVLTGQLQWIYQATRRHEDALAMGKVGPRATPTVDQGMVYTTGGNGVLDCIDGGDGSLIWSQDVPTLVGIDLIPRTNSRGIDYAAETSSLMWGRSCSPLIYQNLVIVAAGGPLEPATGQDPTCTLIAFDKQTGDEVWRGGKRRISYGSPSLVTIGQQEQIVVMAEDHAVGHDPQTGRELWAIERPGSSSAEANCSQVTYIGDDRLLVSKGYGLGGEVLKLDFNPVGGDRAWSVTSLGRQKKLLKTKMTNPFVIDGFAFALSEGFMTCVEILDDRPGLELSWIQRTRYKNGQILNVGDKILVHGQDGVLALLEVNFEQYVELGKISTIQGFCWNTIALYGDLLLVRSERQAACYRLPIQGSPIAQTTADGQPASTAEAIAE